MIERRIISGPALVAATCIALSAGCTLSEPASSVHEVLQITTTSSGGDAGPSVDEGTDAEPTPPPELIFTELMVKSSHMSSGLTALQQGEYVEVKNVGDGPADPRNITITLYDPANADQPLNHIEVGKPSTAEELQTNNSLKTIEPGGYFVFVRAVVTGDPISAKVSKGDYYDYGRDLRAPTLSDDGPVLLTLTYVDEDVDLAIESDKVRWGPSGLVAPDGSGTPLPVSEDHAWMVDASDEDSMANDDPSHWCVATMLFGMKMAGTPGAAGNCGF